MAAPPLCRPRTLPALLEELVEEILLRIPPDEPAHVFRAALVCKAWRRRILSDPGFLRRYRVFHRAPPLLGYLHNLDPVDNPADIPPFAPTTAAAPPLFSTLPGLKCNWWAVDCRHGRVLLRTFVHVYLVVWNPITGGQKKLSLPGYHLRNIDCTGAVLCAVDGCDHLNCHDGPFRVVAAWSGDNFSKTKVAIYTSETGLWSASISIGDPRGRAPRPSLLIGKTLYFSSETDDGMFGDILKFDMGAHELSMLASPTGLGDKNLAMAMEVDGEEVGFVSIDEDNYCIYMWSWERDANNSIGGWTHRMVAELETLLPTSEQYYPYEVVGLLEGTNTIFISVASVGLFALDLKSRKVKKVGESGYYTAILPYTSFYTPDLAKGKDHRRHDAIIDPPT